MLARAGGCGYGLSRRIVQESQRRHRSIEFFSEEIGFEAKVACEDAMQ